MLSDPEADPHTHVPAKVPHHHELTPLLRTDGSTSVVNDDREHRTEMLHCPTTYRREMFYLVMNLLPMQATFILSFLLNVLALYFVTKISTEAVGAVAVGRVVFVTLAPCVFAGFTTCLDTLCSQAYGAGNYRLVCLYLARCLAILMLLLIPIGLVMGCSRWILAPFVDDAETVRLALIYLQCLVPGLPAVAMFEVGKRYLQCQGIFTAGTWINIVLVPFNIGLNYLLIVLDTRFNMGFVGAPVLLAATYYVQCLLLVGYVVFVGGKEIWHTPPLVALCFTNWGQIFRLAIPGVIMVEAEAFAFEVLTFLAAQFGVVELDAQAIFILLSGLAFQVPFASAITGATRLSHYLGSGVAHNAIIVGRCLAMMLLLVGFFNVAWIYFGRFFLVDLFTKDPVVRAAWLQLLAYFLPLQVIDAVNVGLNGSMRGQGRQALSGIILLVLYYVVATPTEAYLAFGCDLKVGGLWLGLLVGVTCLMLVQTWCLVHSDWAKLVAEAKERNEEE